MAAALAGAAIMVTPASAELTISKIYEGDRGWMTEYIHNDDDPTTADRNERAELCNIQARITEGEENFFFVAIAMENGLTASLSFNSQHYDLPKGPLGNATIDIDGAKFIGEAKGRKRVVTISMPPQGLLRKLKDGDRFTATLPGVDPDTWGFDLKDADPALDALAECVKEHIGKDAYAVM